MSHDDKTEATRVRVLLYSDDRTTREDVRLVVGRKVAEDLPELDLVECATPHEAMRIMDAGGIELAILDGESVPLGGLGLTRQMKDEIPNCPPTLVLVARPQDAWLASWSRADGVLPYPIDPIRTPQVVADLLRRRAAVTA